MKTSTFHKVTVLIFFMFLQKTIIFAQQSSDKVILNHIAVYVQDLKTSTWFYSDIIGLDTIPEPFHDGLHTWYKIGPQSQLHLIQGSGTPVPQNKNSHLCFSVPDLDVFINKLNKNNIVFENWAGELKRITHRVDGVKQIYCKDPDGYWIEINDAL